MQNPPEEFQDPPVCACGDEKHIVSHRGEQYFYCPGCNEPFPDLPIPEEELCEVCEQQEAGHTHHVSYVHDITMQVCPECHGRIHDSTDVYNEYRPELSRSEAEKRGHI